MHVRGCRSLRRYVHHFGRRRLLVERSEDFYAEPGATAQRVLAFAGLAIAGRTKSDDAVERGRGGRAWRTQPLSATERNAGLLWAGRSYAGTMRPTERRKLQAFYAPHNRELYGLVGRDMGWEVKAREKMAA